MLPVFLAVPGQPSTGSPSGTARTPVTGLAPSLPPRGGTAPRAPFFSFGYLVLTVALIGLYAILSFLGPHTILEIPLGLFALLFAPGYAIAALLFARQPGLTWAVSLPVTVGLSVVFNVLVGIVLLRVGSGLSTQLGALTDLAIDLFGLVLFGALEPGDAPVGKVSDVSEDLTGPVRALRHSLRFAGFSRGQSAAAVTLLVLILLVFGFIVYVAVSEPHRNLTVSFALYGPGGTVASLPSNATNTTVLGVVLTVSNDATPQGFQILVVSELVTHPNAPPKIIPWSQPLPLGQATKSLLALALGAGENSTVPVSFELTSAVNATLGYNLYTVSFTLENATGVPLQSFQLPLNIT